MYKKVKKFKRRAFDDRLAAICEELIEINDGAFFAISKKFFIKENGELKEEIKTVPIIISSINISSLIIPSTYYFDGENLCNWCDNTVLVKIVYSPMKFIDGNIKEKEIKNLYLDIENEDYIQKVLKY